MFFFFKFIQTVIEVWTEEVEGLVHVELYQELRLKRLK